MLVLDDTGDDGNSDCFDVTLTTKRYGNEISWTLGSCSSDTNYGDYHEYTKRCCLSPGRYTLVCKDSYGDGWHGGYLTVLGTRFCESFNSGREEIVEISLE